MTILLAVAKWTLAALSIFVLACAAFLAACAVAAYVRRDRGQR